MQKVSLNDIEKIITTEYVIDNITDVCDVSLSGINFLEISYLPGIFELPAKMCIRADSVKKIVYKYTPDLTVRE